MAARPRHLVAVGRLEADPAAPWVGLARSAEGFSLAFGEADGAVRVVSAARRELFAVAIAYVDESLAGPPPDLEATHADLAALVAWLADTAPISGAASLLTEALDAIDDGLAEDVVVRRLTAAARAETPEPPDEPFDDWVGVLAGRYRSVSGA